jgi:hypothetical protein
MCRVRRPTLRVATDRRIVCYVELTELFRMRLTPDLKARLMVAAEREGVTASDLVRQATDHWLRQRNY